MTEARHRRAPGEQKLEGEIAPVPRPPMGPSTDSSICNWCSQLDLLGALEKAAQIREGGVFLYGEGLDHGIRIAHVGHRFRHPRSTDCALCSILFASRIYPPQFSTETGDGDELRLIDFLEYSGLEVTLNPWDSTFLAIVPSDFGSDPVHDSQRLNHYICSEGAAVLHRDGVRPALYSVQEVPSVFEPTIVRKWMHYCKSNHSTSCCVSESVWVPGLRLIDCGKLSVTEFDTNKPYVALSYVWGKAYDVNSKLRRAGNRLLLPARLSAVISDAIRVTKALGFQYLWVDRFCIDQENPNDKHQQIKQLDYIYENADLTVVAAAGADETYGLPGVGQTPRTPQRTAKFNGMSVITTMKDPHYSIRSSRWASRGWTFQEATLSRRRLVFTDQQLYFECNTMSCSESIDLPLDKLHQQDKSKSRDLTRAGIFSRFAPGMRSSEGEYWKRVTSVQTNLDTLKTYGFSVNEYSLRELKYDSDSLNAFQGIIQRYAKLQRPVNTIWGMPYTAQGEKRGLYFCVALCWRHELNSPNNSKCPRRRPEFPSWTWTGWEGGVESATLYQHLEEIPRIGIQSRAGIPSIRFGDQGQEKECDLQLFDCTISDAEWRILRLLAKVLPPRKSWQPIGGGNRHWDFNGASAILFASEMCMLEANFVQELMDVENWRCIWVCSMFLYSHVMILKRDHDTNTWKRAGMLLVDYKGWQMQRMTASQEPTWYDIE